MIVDKKRNPYIDALKGLAITFVVWGHTIQCMGIDPTAYSNYIGKFIYLFHMPLFFFLSGYVSQGVMIRKFIPLVKSRLKTLFYPMCIWCGVLFLFNAFLTDIYIYI